MTVMARRSSTTARVSRNVRSAVGRWVDSSPSAAHPETGRRRWSDSGPTANSDIARYACIHGEFAHTNAAPAATSSRIPPTVSLRRISEKRCVSDHEPRVSSRLGVAIAESLVILGDIRIRLPGRPLYGIFTCGAPGSLVGSRTAGDDFGTAAGVATWRCNRGSVQFGAAKEPYWYVPIALGPS